MTQTQLAVHLGIHQPALSSIEKGTTAPRDALKFKLAGALGLTVEELFPFPAVVPPFPEGASAVAS